MKNIYEDNQHEGEVKKSDFRFETPNEAVKPKADGEKENSDDEVIQLTREQLNSILALLQKPETEKSPVPSEAPTKPAVQQDRANPGKKILFQSDDFDSQPTSGERKLPPIVSGRRPPSYNERNGAQTSSREGKLPTIDTGRKIISQSDDFDTQPISTERKLPPIDSGRKIISQSDDFDTQSISAERKLPPIDTGRKIISQNGVSEKKAKTVKHTVFDSNFDVSEIDFDESELSAPTPQKPKIQRPQKPTVVKTSSTKDSGDEEAVSGEQQPTERFESARVKGNMVYSSSTFSPTVEDIEQDEEEPDVKKKLSKGEIVRRVVLVVALVAIVVSGAYLIREYVLHKNNAKLEGEISNLIITEPTTEKSDKDKDKNTTKKPKDTKKTEEQMWAEVKAEYPDAIFPPGMQAKYAKLYVTNPDFVGYIDVPGINLSLPVVQTTDDEIYLGKNFYGEKTKYGCPFVSHANNVQSLDRNTIIYGHHMNDGTIFGALDKYKTLDGFKAAPVIEFNTLYSNYKWKVIAAFITNANEKDDNGYVFEYYYTNLSTEEHFSSYLNEIAQRSLYDTGVDVTPSDKILTLSTCSHEFDDARFVVVARLVRTGESAKVDTSLAVENSNPRFPQTYYDKKRTKNPYKNASRWYPN